MVKMMIHTSTTEEKGRGITHGCRILTALVSSMKDYAVVEDLLFS